jgi:hypothetical protein
MSQLDLTSPLDRIRAFFKRGSAWIEGKPEELLAGMQVQDKHGRLYLVGDVNENGGVCDCCCDMRTKYVVRWRMLEVPKDAPGTDVHR